MATRVQMEVLVLIAKLKEETGQMPTYRELADRRRCYVRSIAFAAEGLWKAGLLRWNGEARGFKFTPEGEYALSKVERF